jgi:hypothetical protein
VSANLIFPINYHSDIPHVEKSIVAKGCSSLYALKFTGVSNNNNNNNNNNNKTTKTIRTGIIVFWVT